jgi:hypothetical protein
VLVPVPLMDLYGHLMTFHSNFLRNFVLLNVRPFMA